MYYHRLGENQEQDVMVVEFPDQPKFRMYVCVYIDEIANQITNCMYPSTVAVESATAANIWC